MDASCCTCMAWRIAPPTRFGGDARALGSHCVPWPTHQSDPGECWCLNLSTSMGGTRSKVEGGDRHDLEPEGTREDTRHEIYTGSGSRSSYPTSCLE
jgi:hypothetical protein